jgi:serine/threonine protein kinase
MAFTVKHEHEMTSSFTGYMQVSADTIDSDQSSIDGKDEKVEDNPIPIAELVKFAFQVATGMDYVSRQGIVHRDLATRNCMLTWDMNVKVSDFGLARMLEEGKDYYRMGHGCALPIRWMAPESISDFLFTTESDVVSNSYSCCTKLVRSSSLA